jgi:hypothetical protein
MAIIDAIPGTLEWRVYKGDTATLTLIVRDADDAPIDLSGWSFIAQAKLYQEDELPEIYMPATANESGIIAISIELTSQLPEMLYFDVQGTNNETGVVKTFVKGIIVAEQDVSRIV